MKKRLVIGLSVFFLLVVGLFIVFCFLPTALFSIIGEGGRIHCWVKVVDQNGHVVPGYKCNVTEEGGSRFLIWPRGDVFREFITDATGMFEYKSKGSVRRILIGHPWWRHWKSNPGHLMEHTMTAVTPYGLQNTVDYSSSKSLGSKEIPYLIHVFSVGPPQKLLYWRKRVKLENPENYACVDLLEGRIWESDKPEGDIAMKDNPITSENIEKHCLHSFIAGNAFQIYPVVDDWGLQPPDEGYTGTLCFDKDWIDKKTRLPNAIQFYYRLVKREEGEIFGRVTLGLSPRVHNAEIENFTNLQGERNLFYKGYLDLDHNHAIQEYISPPVTWEEIVEGKYKKLTEMKKDGGNVDERDYNGQTALIKAATSGKKEVCEFLIEKGARVHEKDFKGESALFKAVEYGHKEIAELLISKGADVNDSNSENVTVLMRAAGRGDKGICELLISKGADINARDNDGRTALMYAVWAGHREVCEFLISKGADVNKRDNNGKTALKIAKDSNHISIILYLKSIGGKE
jgi:hypothetical protein